MKMKQKSEKRRKNKDGKVLFDLERVRDNDDDRRFEEC